MRPPARIFSPAHENGARVGEREAVLHHVGLRLRAGRDGDNHGEVGAPRRARRGAAPRSAPPARRGGDARARSQEPVKLRHAFVHAQARCAGERAAGERRGSDRGRSTRGRPRSRPRPRARHVSTGTPVSSEGRNASTIVSSHAPIVASVTRSTRTPGRAARSPRERLHEQVLEAEQPEPRAVSARARLGGRERRQLDAHRLVAPRAARPQLGERAPRRSARRGRRRSSCSSASRAA